MGKGAWRCVYVCVCVHAQASPSSPVPPVTPAMAMKVLYQIACGAMCLHSRSITHRDLNTNNVLVYCLEYERLNVRVSDFGLSRELEAGVAATMTGGGLSWLLLCVAAAPYRRVCRTPSRSCRLRGFACLHCAGSVGGDCQV